MNNSHTGLTKRAVMLSAAVAALGLVLGLAFVAPVGAQDGGDNYTTVGPTDDATGGACTATLMVCVASTRTVSRRPCS